jgi:hypothetical protein
MVRMLHIAVMVLALTLVCVPGCKKVTEAQCGKVKNGMDITQVAKVLGNRGDEKATGSTAGLNVTHRTWSNADGSACDVMFRKGKVYKILWTK